MICIHEWFIGSLVIKFNDVARIYFIFVLCIQWPNGFKKLTLYRDNIDSDRVELELHVN